MNWIEATIEFGLFLLLLYVFYLVIQIANYLLDEAMDAKLKKTEK